MEGIQAVVQGEGFVRIELDDDFYVALNSGGAIVGYSNGTPQDDHAHLDPEAAKQVARTILSYEFGEEA